MKKYSLSIFILLVSCVFLFAQTTNAQLVARPVVFVDQFEMMGESKRLHEYVDMQERLNKAIKTQQTNQCNTSRDGINKLMQGQQDLQKKIMACAATIAKEKGACALLESRACGTDIYVDPTYDITNEVIDKLNKLYVRPKDNKSLDDSPQEILYNALLNNSEDEIRMAVKAGAHVNSSIHGKTPLFIAVALAHSNAVKCLLECGAQGSPDLIQLAIEKNDVKSVVLLAKSCNANFNTIHSFLVTQGMILYLDFESMLYLIKIKPELAKIRIGESALIEHIVKGFDGSNICCELIQYITDCGYNINDLWGSKLEAIYRNVAALKFIIKKGANVNISFNDAAGPWTPLLKAINEGNEEIVRALIDAGSDINKKADLYKNYPQSSFRLKGLHSPLSLAIKKYDKCIIKLLIERGAVA